MENQEEKKYLITGVDAEHRFWQQIESYTKDELQQRLIYLKSEEHFLIRVYEIAKELNVKDLIQGI